MNAQVWRGVALIAAMVGGIACPWASAATGGLKYLIMVMLWLSFLGVRFHWGAFQRTHFVLLGAMLALSLAAYWILLPLGKEYAQVGWLLALTPTATAAPAVTELLGGAVEYVALAVIFTHLAVGLNLPWMLPMFAQTPGVSLDIYHLLLPTLEVILIPLVLASLCKWLPEKSFQGVMKLKKFGFLLWICVLFLAVARGSQFFIDQPKTPLTSLLIVFAISAVICVLNFQIGRWIGGKKTPIESSQSLGQKNTLLSIWIALSFISPFVALGPICYILCHNAYNSWQLFRSKARLNAQP